MKKILLILVILLFLSITGFCLDEWVSPTSFDDPDFLWNNEENIYDGNTGVGADSYNSVAKTWGSFIELNITEIECTKIRFYAYFDAFDINEIDVDLYYNETWNELYEGIFANQTWEEKEIGSLQDVTKARIRFYAKKAATAYLYEFEFSEYSEAPLGSVTFQTLTEEIDDTSKEYITMACPPGTQIGDLLIAFITKDDNEVVDPNGAWIEIVSQGSDAHAVYVAYRIATVTDGEWTWTETSGGEDWYGVILRYTGHDLDTPIHDSDFTIESVGTDAPIAPSIDFTNLTAGSACLQLFGADDNDVPYQVPAALTPALFNNNVTDTGGAGGDKAVSGTGSTDTAVFGTTAADEWIAVTVIIHTPQPVRLGASRIADASRVDQSGVDDGDVKGGIVWDISTFVYADKSINIESLAPIVNDLYFKPDGLAVMILDYSTVTIYQYTLSAAWDINTATYAEKSKDVSAQATACSAFAFKLDGTIMYVLDPTGLAETIYQYTLSTAWDISTATYANKSFFIRDITIDPVGMFIHPLGTYMYVIGYAVHFLHQVELATPWDISTASAYQSYDVGNEDLNPNHVYFKSDGLKFYIIGGEYHSVFQYTLSIAWDVTEASYDSKFLSVAAQDTTSRGVHFSSDGSKMYHTGRFGDSTVYQYAIPVAWTKTNDFILATRIYTSFGTTDASYKLRWRDVTDVGSFADVSDTGEITYSATTDLTDDGELIIGEVLCDVEDGYSWKNGLESEGDNLSPDAGTYSLTDEYYTELHWALDCNGADDEHKYEFELYDVTLGIPVGLCVATITMAVTEVAGLKWNTKTITKWNTKEVTEINTQ